MTQNLWQEKLKLTCPKGVVDIVVFGSAVFGMDGARDLDISVIFEKIPLKVQLECSQKIKNELKKKVDKEIHISSFDFYSLLNEGNFARDGILFYGKSLISGKNFSENFGLVPKLRIKYDLKDLEKKGKVRFNYLLNGKQGNYGLIKKYGGKIVSPGVLEISPEYERIFTEKMKNVTDKLTLEKCFTINS